MSFEQQRQLEKPPKPSSRPSYIRRHTNYPSCHPTLLTRSQLGNTSGSAYLPASDSPPRSSAILLDVSLFGSSDSSPQSPSYDSRPRLQYSRSAPYSRVGKGSEWQNQSTCRAERPPSDCINKSLFVSKQDLSTPQRSDKIQGNPVSIRDTVNGLYSKDAIVKPQERHKRLNCFDGTAGETRPDDDPYGQQATGGQSSEVENSQAIKVQLVGEEGSVFTHAASEPDGQVWTFSDPFNGVAVPRSRRASGSSDVSSYLRPHAFSGHRDTLARLRRYSSFDQEDAIWSNNSTRSGSSVEFSDRPARYSASYHDAPAGWRLRPKRSENIPDTIVALILQYLSFEDYKSLRLTCRTWTSALPSPMYPPSYRLPTEVLHCIYQYLEPCDYDSARHTCLPWFLASLDNKISQTMIQKAGCDLAVKTDIENRRVMLLSHRATHPSVESDGEYETGYSKGTVSVPSEEWLISKRLATECRLSAAWHGSGCQSDVGHRSSRLGVTQIVDFTPLAFQDINTFDVKRFTVSACGGFVLIICNTDILVYSLDARDIVLKPCARLIAGEEVLSVSMDASSGRFSVAALLKGRIGMCWDLNNVFDIGEAGGSLGESTISGMQTDVHESTPLDIGPSLAMSLPLPREGSTGLLTEEKDVAKENRYSFAFFKRKRTSPGDMDAGIPNPQPQRLSGGASTDAESNGGQFMATRSEPNIVYKNLGCSNDPPLSVAVCPQRKCVAFGCRSGIELHWTDAMTGDDLSRWFPLAAPSDLLYFLPQKAGVGPTKKLRLVSSAAAPFRREDARYNSALAKWRYSTLTHRHGRQQSVTRSSSGNLPFTATRNIDSSFPLVVDVDETHDAFRTVDCDHHRAIPLSDGTHMLFTDPTTGLLCLGSDAPLGGPTKLIRKVCMIPSAVSDSAAGSLVCYAAGRDLRWGVRVVAAYDDGRIDLFNVPSDWFEHVRYLDSSPDMWDGLAGAMSHSSPLMDVFMLDEIDFSDEDQTVTDRPAFTSPTSFRSVRINGAFVRQAKDDVDDLCVDSRHGGLRVWIFYRSGKVDKLDIFAPQDHSVQSYSIGPDGSIHQNSPSSTRSQGEIEAESRRSLGSRKETTVCDKQNSPHIRFCGSDGAGDTDPEAEYESDVSFAALQDYAQQKGTIMIASAQGVDHAGRKSRAFVRDK